MQKAIEKRDHAMAQRVFDNEDGLFGRTDGHPSLADTHGRPLRDGYANGCLPLAAGGPRSCASAPAP